MANLNELSDYSTEVLESETPVLLDFWARWCGPCRALGPVLEDVADKYEGKLKVLKVNVDAEANQGLVSRFGIRGIPNLAIIVDGKQKDSLVGFQPQSNIESFIDKNIV